MNAVLYNTVLYLTASLCYNNGDLLREHPEGGYRSREHLDGFPGKAVQPRQISALG